MTITDDRGRVLSKYSERQDLLGMALDLHMWCTGSGPDLSDEDRQHASSFINDRLLTWTVGAYPSVFDEAVRMLLVATMAEVRERLLHSNPTKTTPDIPGMKQLQKDT